MSTTTMTNSPEVPPVYEAFARRYQSDPADPACADELRHYSAGWTDATAVSAADNAALRQIIRDVVAALGTTAGCSADASLDFLRGVPEEVRLTVAALRAENERMLAANRDCIDWYTAAKTDLDAARKRVEELEAGVLEGARRVEALKRECGMDPESPIAVQNGRYMSVSYFLRALLSQPKEPT